MQQENNSKGHGVTTSKHHLNGKAWCRQHCHLGHYSGKCSEQPCLWCLHSKKLKACDEFHSIMAFMVAYFSHCCVHVLILPGIEPRGNMVLKPAEFLVETVEAGLGEVLVYVEDPEGHTEEVWITTCPHLFDHFQSEPQLEIHWCLFCIRPESSPTTIRTEPTLWSTCPKWKASTRWEI